MHSAAWRRRSEGTGKGRTPKTEPKAEPKKAEPKREPFDIGKMKALYDRGWSAAMVADEMGVSVQTIYNKAKKEGLKFGKAVSV